MELNTERREYLRADLGVFVTEETRRATTIAKVSDVSERGLAYSKPVGQKTRRDAELFLEFSLPSELEPIRATGKVVYEQVEGQVHATAIEFTRIDSRDAVRIRNYVGSRKRAEIFELLRRQHLDS